MILKKMKSTFIKIFIILGIIIIVTGFIQVWNKGDSLKTAIKKEDLKGSKYILCKYVEVTGYYWMSIQDENGEKYDTYCIIKGADPRKLKLSYEFITADNTYVFYVKSKRRYYSKELKENCIEYTASGWDILYPIKKLFPWNIIGSRKYITTRDTFK